MTHSRDRLLLTAAITILLAVGVCTAGAVRWVGAPFPGFLVLENRVVASAGLAHWPATEGGRIYQHEIVAVDGRPLEDVHELHALVASQRPGTEIRYRFRRGQHCGQTLCLAFSAGMAGADPARPA